MLFTFLYKLGVHIGSKKYESYDYYKPFLLGYKSNYCIFDIKKVIYLLKKACYFFYALGYEKCKFLFHYHSFKKIEIYFKFFFLKELEQTKNFFFDEKWSYGQLSNSLTMCNLLFTDIFEYKGKNKKLKIGLHKEISFIDFFFSLLFFTFHKRIPGMDWETHIKRIKKYWRFFLFFKFYRYLNKFPESFLFFTSINNFGIPAIEAHNLKIPVISILDTNYNFFNNITYPIYSNTQNIFVFFFYFVFLISFYKKGNQHMYLTFIK